MMEPIHGNECECHHEVPPTHTHVHPDGLIERGCDCRISDYWAEQVIQYAEDCYIWYKSYHEADKRLGEVLSENSALHEAIAELL